MDINDLRGVMSAVILVTFMGLFVWTWMGRRDRFREAAELPFADEPQAGTGREPETPPRREAGQDLRQSTPREEHGTR